MHRKKRVAIIGLGASGLFALKRLAGALDEVHVYDVGLEYDRRYACPISQKKLVVCPPDVCGYCAPAQSGGTFTDGKVIITPSPVIGGRLWDHIGPQALQNLLYEVRDTFLEHAPCQIPIARPSEEDQAWIRAKAAAAGMEYHHQELLHCGSDYLPEINNNILNSISGSCSNIVFHWNTKVLSLARQGSQFVVKHEKFRCNGTDPAQEEVFDFAIVSVGRGGSNWLTQQEFYPVLDTQPGPVDVGVRVETKNEVMQELDRFYECKMYFTTPSGDLWRNFCANIGGEVAVENHKNGGYVLVNGHSKAKNKSENNNFAVQGMFTFTRPFRNPQQYASNLAKTVNELAGGGPMVQRFGDLMAGRRTKSLDGNRVRPTLQAECGDLGLGYTHRILEGAKQYLMALDKICPGIADADTLLYGPECKTYPDKIALGPDMQATTVPGLWIVGDSSSFTRGIGQASCSGLLAGEGVRRTLSSS